MTVRGLRSSKRKMSKRSNHARLKFPKTAMSAINSTTLLLHSFHWHLDRHHVSQNNINTTQQQNLIMILPEANGLPFVVTDIALAAINIFNLFVFLCLLHPVKSPLKHIGLVAMKRVVEPVHRVRFLTAIIFTFFAVMAISAGIFAHKSDWKDSAMIIRSLVSLYTLLMTSIFMKLNDVMIKLGIDKVLDIEREMEQHNIVTFQPPSVTTIDTLMAPMKPFLRVDATGLDNIPSNIPHLFVMNHSLYGIEMPFLIQTLYKQKGVFVRGLADHVHFATPNGPVLKYMGAVDGTRDNVDVLMESKQDVLVYPGGAHEVLKHSSVPRYNLMWKERLGFARMAIKHKYPIIPCAAVGTEDMLETIMDIPLEWARKGQYIPVALPTGKIQKVYFWFGEPINTEQYNGDYENTEFAREVRDKVKAAVEAGIQELRETQEVDPDRYLMDQFTASLKSSFYNAYKTFLKSLGIGAYIDAGEETPILTNEANNDFLSIKRKSA